MAIRKVETIRELRRALANVPGDVTIQLLFDGADYRSLGVEDCYPVDPDSRFVRFTLIEE